jgi:hypothetical protein
LDAFNIQLEEVGCQEKMAPGIGAIHKALKSGKSSSVGEGLVEHVKRIKRQLIRKRRKKYLIANACSCPKDDRSRR